MNIIERNSKRLLTESKAKPLLIRDSDSSMGEIVLNTKMWTEKKRVMSKLAYDHLLRQEDALSNIVSIENANEMSCVNEKNDVYIESSVNMSKFSSKIPKPSAAFSIKYDKYVDLPTKIPKLKST